MARFEVNSERATAKVEVYNPWQPRPFCNYKLLDKVVSEKFKSVPKPKQNKPNLQRLFGNAPPRTTVSSTTDPDPYQIFKPNVFNEPTTTSNQPPVAPQHQAFCFDLQKPQEHNSNLHNFFGDSTNDTTRNDLNPLPPQGFQQPTASYIPRQNLAGSNPYRDQQRLQVSTLAPNFDQQLGYNFGADSERGNSNWHAEPSRFDVFNQPPTSHNDDIWPNVSAEPEPFRLDFGPSFQPTAPPTNPFDFQVQSSLPEFNLLPNFNGRNK